MSDARDTPKVVIAKASDCDPEGRTECLDRALEEAGFFAVLEGLPRSTPVAIKANVGPASQRGYHYYTDPVLVDHLWDRVEAAGFGDVAIVESETTTSNGFSNATPDVMGPGLGYRHPVTNLTVEETRSVRFHGHELALSERLFHSFTISFAKGKNHDLMWFTGALKNMYGAIPMDKYQSFHHRKSGLDVADAILAVNLLQTPRFSLVDWIDGVDGSEACYFPKKLGEDELKGKHAHPQHIIAGADALAVDEVLCRKMGYDPRTVPVLVRVRAEWAGRRAGGHEVAQGEGGYEVVGDTLAPLAEWRRLPRLTHWKASLQDRIPFISNSVVGANIRKYHFDDELFEKGVPR